MSKEPSARMWTTKLNKNQLENTDYKEWRLYTKIQSKITLKQLTNFGKLIRLYYKSIIECILDYILDNT